MSARDFVCGDLANVDRSSNLSIKLDLHLQGVLAGATFLHGLSPEQMPRGRIISHTMSRTLTPVRSRVSALTEPHVTSSHPCSSVG